MNRTWLMVDDLQIVCEWRYLFHGLFLADWFDYLRESCDIQLNVSLSLFWLVVTGTWLLFSHILGISSSQLTNSNLFQRGRVQPPVIFLQHGILGSKRSPRSPSGSRSAHHLTMAQNYSKLSTPNSWMVLSYIQHDQKSVGHGWYPNGLSCSPLNAMRW